VVGAQEMIMECNYAMEKQTNKKECTLFRFCDQNKVFRSVSLFSITVSIKLSVYA